MCLEYVVCRDPSLNEIASMCAGHCATRGEAAASWIVEDETLDNIRNTIAEHGWWVGLVAQDGDQPGFSTTTTCAFVP